MADRVEIPGSARVADPQHERVGEVDQDKPIEVTVYLRPSGSLDWVDQEAGQPPSERRTMSREELADATGASDEDIAAVRSFAGEYGLEVTGVDKGRRAVTLRGTVEAVSRAFGARDLQVFEHPTGGQYRGRQGPLTVPSRLGDVITGVFGIDERPQARAHLRQSATPAQSYTPPEVAAAYSFPTSVNGSGQTAGILELGGGFSQTDLDTYFKSLGLTPPSVSAVSVDGGKNSPGTDTDADGEVMLDIEVLGSVAPGAKIVVYFAPNTDQGFIDALSTAVHDTTNKPSVVSISWGGPEDSWTQQARTQMEQILTEAAAVGVAVTVASGDSGSTDGESDGKQHVDFPASAPHALGCGGTTLKIENAKIASETVWNELPNHGAGGGGISVEFAVPSYQSAIKMPTNVDTGKAGRGVPDVAGNADPETGYKVLVDGSQQTIGGTSAVAPLWAGLIVLLNASLGKPVGFLQPQIYAASAATGFHDITQGNNVGYQAGPGWDACTGNGSPDGAALLTTLGG
ncbi:MAG TPA: S53 family peptidase [Solirubrobacteraceae bacterium]|nr:S53 family peptidase [Solirubrobacteraceae bacterium]